MELDDAGSRPHDLLAALTRQDLDPLSVEELDRRIQLLEAEILRSRARIEIAIKHRATADAIFRS